MASKEAKLQSEMVKWYRNEWYENPKCLWATFNEGVNIGGKISMGMLGGVSDLLLYERYRRGLIGIEIKYPGESHNVDHVIRQAKWILDVCNRGGFCDSVEQFKKIIKGEFDWYSPSKVLRYLESLKTKSFTWDSSKFI